MPSRRRFLMGFRGADREQRGVGVSRRSRRGFDRASSPAAQPAGRVRRRHRRRRLVWLRDREPAEREPQTCACCVLEAGGSDANPLIQAPGKWTSLLGSPLDWNLHDRGRARAGGRQVKWPRGKGLGGSSSINAMAYVRGHQLCFDGWAAESGPMWSYGELLRAVPPARGQLARRVGLPRRRRRPRGRRHDRSACRAPGVPRSGAAARIFGTARLGFQWRAPGERRRLLSEEHPRRPAPFGRRGVSRARAGAAEPHRVAEDAGAQDSSSTAGA